MSKMVIRNAVTGVARDIAVPARKAPKAKTTEAPASAGGDKEKAKQSSAGKGRG